MSRNTSKLLSLFPCLILFAIATPAFAQSQSWTSANGKFSIKAEFVQLKNDKVQLKKENNGNLIWVELAKLSSDAQKQAKRMQKEADAKAAEANQPDENELLDQIELECTAELKESDFNGEDPQVVVSIVASGSPAADAMRYGKVKLEKFTDGSGAKLSQEEDRFSMNDISKTFEKIDRNSMFASHPEDGIAVELKLPTDSNPEMIGEVSGSFRILTGGERSITAVSNLADIYGKTAKNEGLTKAKLKIEVEKPSTDDNGFSMSFNVSGNLGALNRIWIGDTEKEELDEQQGSSNSTFGRKANFSFFFKNDVSDTAVLYVETVEGAIDLKIPFEFRDIKVAGQ